MTLGATLVASLLVDARQAADLAAGPRRVPPARRLPARPAPIVVLPSAVSLSNVLTPLLSTVVFRGYASIVLPLLAVGLGGLLWLLGGGLVAAAAESEGVRTIAADDDAWPAGRPPRVLDPAEHPAWRVLTVRLIAHLPLLLAVSWGAFRIVAVTYRELTVPSDVAVGIAFRVARGAPDAVAVVIGAWILGETVGGIAARRVILLGEPIRGRWAGPRSTWCASRCAAPPWPPSLSRPSPSSSSASVSRVRPPGMRFGRR